MRLLPFIVVFFSLLFYTNMQIFAQGKIKAVIIGVSEYPNLSKENQLEYADKDAEAFYNYLKKIPNADTLNIHKFINNHANDWNKIDRKIQGIIESSTSEDLVIVYFAGHGETQSLILPGYLLLYGAESSYDWATLPSAFPLEVLEDISQKKNCRVLIIADACHAGSIKNAQKIENTQEENAQKALEILKNEINSSLKMLSCDIKEKSVESQDWGGGHGMFTFHLLNGAHGLADANGDNWVTFDELSSYISEESQKDNISQGITQTPQFMGDAHVNLFNIAGLEKEILKKSFDSENKNEKNNRGLLQSIETDNDALIDTFYKLIKQNKLISPKYYEEDCDNVFSFKNLVHKKNFFAKNVLIGNDNSLFTSCSKNPYLKSYHLDSLDLNFELKKQKNAIINFALSPNGEKLITYDEKEKIKIWDLEKRKVLKKIKNPHKSGIPKIVYSNSGNYFATFSSNEVIVRNAKDYSIYKTAVFERKKITDLIFTPNDKKIIATTQDKFILIYDMDSSKVVKSIKKHTQAITNIKLSDNHSFYYTYNQTGEIMAFDIVTNEIIFQKKIKVRSDFHIINKYIVYKNKNKLIFQDFITNTTTGIEELNKINVLDFYVNKNDFNKNKYDKNKYDKNKYDKNKFIIVSRNEVFSLDIILPRLALSANYILKQLSNSDISQNVLFDLKSALFVAINSNSDKVIDLLINNKEIIVDEIPFDKLIAELNVAMELFPNYNYLIRKIKTNILLLEVYKIIITNDTKSYDLALTKLKQILEISPSATFPYDAMGKIYLKQRKLELADSMFNIAIKRIPAWTEPQNSLGENYLRQNKDTNAINQYENIIQLEPKLALGYNKIGKIYTEAGAYSKAEDYFRFSLKADSLNSITYSLYSNLQILRGRYYEADKIIENALSINPKDFETNKNKANLQLLMYEKVDIDQNYLTKAHEHYQKLIEFYPYNDESYTLLSNYYIKLLSFQQTEIPYSICNLFSSDSCKVKVLNEIESLCTKALELNPFSTEAYNGLAYVNHSRNANDEALQFFQRGIDVDKINPSGYYNFGLFYMGKNDTKNAIKYFKQAIEKDTKFLPAYIDLWNIYSAQKNNAALDSLYKVTTEIFYDSPIFFHKNGTREDDKNINDIERAIEIDPQYLYSEISKENIGYNKNSSKNEEASAKIVEKLGFSFKRNDKFFDKFLVVEKNDKRGIMHINGELIIPFSFDSIIVIDPETICAIKNDTLFSHTLYWYNSIGKITTYQSKIEDYWYDEECFVFKRKDSKYACFDKYNNQILGYEFDGITPFNPKNNLLKVQMGNNFGCYNRQGKVVIKILFKQIDALNAYGVEGCRCITIDNKTQEFNNTGTPMTY